MTSGDYVMWTMVGIFVFLVLFILALGVFYPGSGAKQLRWKPTRSPEVEAQNEVDDIDQMLEAANARRARRGAAPLTEQGLHEQVREHEKDLAERRDAHMLEEELEQVLEARNERRRRRGLPEMTIDELRASLDA